MTIDRWNKVIENFTGKRTTISYEHLDILLNYMPPELRIKIARRNDKKKTCQLYISWKGLYTDLYT